jgi:uncharacterized protein YjiS (DUF1127 family)
MVRARWAFAPAADRIDSWEVHQMTTDTTPAMAARPTGFIVALYARWRQRRRRREQLAALLDMNVYRLDDLGLSGVDIAAAIADRRRPRGRSEGD